MAFSLASLRALHQVDLPVDGVELFAVRHSLPA
jgi:hypothetical protein